MKSMEIRATIKELNNLSCLSGSIVSVIKSGSTSGFTIIVKSGNIVYYHSMWLSNYMLFDDIYKEIELQFKLAHIKMSDKFKKLLSKMEATPFYLDWGELKTTTNKYFGENEIRVA